MFPSLKKGIMSGYHVLKHVVVVFLLLFAGSKVYSSVDLLGRCSLDIENYSTGPLLKRLTDSYKYFVSVHLLCNAPSLHVLYVAHAREFNVNLFLAIKSELTDS